MKKTLALIVLSISITLAGNSNAHAETYDFTGTSASGYYVANEIDGSTLTITGGSLAGWNFTDLYLGPFSSPGNTSIVSQDITSYDSSGWTGNIELEYSGLDIFITGDSFSAPDLQSSIQGTWTAAASAPDGASTCGLLCATLAGLGACRRLLRRQQAA